MIYRSYRLPRRTEGLTEDDATKIAVTEQFLQADPHLNQESRDEQ
jgi:hypothetical protein